MFTLLKIKRKVNFRIKFKKEVDGFRVLIDGDDKLKFDSYKHPINFYLEAINGHKKFLQLLNK